tara:strand:+ start:96 stop:863 length:768 start_codon:yes stop_codon:yes gene_type:complete
MILFIFPLHFSNDASHARFETTDKIILPYFALDDDDVLCRLAEQESSPLIVKLENSATSRVMYCGLGLSSEKVEHLYVPEWVRTNLLADEGDPIAVSFEFEAQQASKVVLRPLSVDFFNDIDDQKVVLERALRDYTALTLHQEFAFSHGGKTYHMSVGEILDTQGESCFFCCITDCDVVVDFDMSALPRQVSVSVPPEPLLEPLPEPLPEPPLQPPGWMTRFPGRGRRLEGAPLAAALTSRQKRLMSLRQRLSKT